MAGRGKSKDYIICNDCRVLDFGMCPNLIVMYDNGMVNPSVKRCAWKVFFDNAHEEIKATAIKSAKGTTRKDRVKNEKD